MATRIRLKRSYVPGKIPLVSDLRSAELAYNVPDGIIYAKRERSGLGTDIINVGYGVSVPNLIYVAKNGNDFNTGTRLGDAKLTIQGAVAISTAGTVIKVLPGTYSILNPLQLPSGVSIVGEDASNVIFQPSNQSDLIYLNDSCLVSNITFNGTSNGNAIFSFDPNTVTQINNPPNIKNCYNYIPESTGLRINGDDIGGDLKGVFVTDFQHHGASGIGISVTNKGYSQVKSLHTFCNNISVYVGTGGVCNIIGSNSTFGNYGLYANGVSSTEYSAKIESSTAENVDTFIIKELSNNPNEGQVAYFDQLYYTVTRVNIINGGSGYSRRPSVTIESPPTSWGINASAVATLTEDKVTSIDIISNGRGYITEPTIIISSPDVGLNTATASVVISPTYYKIQSSTPLVSGISTITINETLPYSLDVNDNVYFLKQSRIIAASHTFEYVGTGTDKSTAYPGLGGKPIQENEIVSLDGGIVIFSSTDHNGNFRIGEGIVIDQSTGSITGSVYTRSIFNNVTPLILALGGE